MYAGYRSIQLTEDEIDGVFNSRIVRIYGMLSVSAHDSLEVETISVPDIVFSLDFDATYTIGSNLSCDFFLPSKVDAAKVHVEDYEVLVRRPFPFSGAVAAERHYIFAPDGSIKLNENAEVKFGEFTLTYSTKLVLPSSRKKRLRNVGCLNCSLLKSDSTFLKCDHLICKACVNSFVISRLDSGFRFQDLTMYCRLCQATTRISDVVGNNYIDPTLVDLLMSIISISKLSLICSLCRNSRVLVGAEEFHECRTCKLTLCSPCSLSNFHRTHDVALLIFRITTAYCRMFKTIYTIEQEMRPLLLTKKEFYSNHSTTKKNILRPCHLKLKSLDYGLNNDIFNFGEKFLRLECAFEKCARINNEVTDKKCDSMIDELYKKLTGKDSKFYDKTMNELEKSYSVLSITDIETMQVIPMKKF